MPRSNGLWGAAKAGDVDQIALYLAKPLWAGRINAMDPQSGHPPVALAAWRGHVEATAYLLDAGADAGTAIEAATRGSSLSTTVLVKMLIERGSESIDQVTPTGRTIMRNNRGWRPLHFAAYYGRTSVARVLVSGGASINARDTNGDTPLHIAAGNDHLSMVLLLCELGADRHLLGNKRRTPLQLAQLTYKTCGHQDSSFGGRDKRHQQEIIQVLTNRPEATRASDSTCSSSSSPHLLPTTDLADRTRPPKRAASSTAEGAPSFKHYVVKQARRTADASPSPVAAISPSRTTQAAALKHKLRQAFTAHGSDRASYKACKETLQRSLHTLIATAKEKDEQRGRGLEALRAMLALLSPPHLTAIAHDLHPLLPRAWKDDWSRLTAALPRTSPAANSGAIHGAHGGTSDDDGDAVTFVGERTWEERDAELRAAAVAIDD
jgi:hypothetical protein